MFVFVVEVSVEYRGVYLELFWGWVGGGCSQTTCSTHCQAIIM